MPRPDNLLTSNHWTFEIPGFTFPNFQKVSGISKKSGEVSIVDGTTNIKHKYSSQLKEFNDITLVRPYDLSIDDASIRALVALSFDESQRFDGALVKYHNKTEVFRIMFFGLRVKEVKHPDLDTAAEERYDVELLCSVSEWEEIPTV